MEPDLLRQLLTSPLLDEGLAHYERALPGSEDRTYAYLIGGARRKPELSGQETNRKALLSHNVGGGSAPALAAEKREGREGTQAEGVRGCEGIVNPQLRNRGPSGAVHS